MRRFFSNCPLSISLLLFSLFICSCSSASDEGEARALLAGSTTDASTVNGSEVPTPGPDKQKPTLPVASSISFFEGTAGTCDAINLRWHAENVHQKVRILKETIPSDGEPSTFDKSDWLASQTDQYSDSQAEGFVGTIHYKIESDLEEILTELQLSLDCRSDSGGTIVKSGNPPAPVSSLLAEEVNCTKLAVSWDKPETPFDHYELRYWRHGDVTSDFLENWIRHPDPISRDSEEFSLTNLLPDSNYSIRVKTVKTFGSDDYKEWASSEWREDQEETCQDNNQVIPTLDPQNLTGQTNGCIVTLNWDKPTDPNFDHYQVHRSLVDEDGFAVDYHRVDNFGHYSEMEQVTFVDPQNTSGYEGDPLANTVYRYRVKTMALPASDPNYVNVSSAWHKVTVTTDGCNP